MANLVIQSSTGRDVTTSLIVASVFGKEHKNVLRDIESLSCSESFRVLNFEQTPYKHPQNGQTYKMYEMTKDGFSFLVMGYTGKKAGQFKEAFINEFNKREMMLKSDDYILARSQEILNNRLQLAEQQLQMAQGTIEVQQEQIKTLSPKAQYTDEVLQSTSTFTATQMAKDLGMSAISFNQKLKDWGVQFKQSGQWFLTSKYHDRGYTDMRVSKYIDQKTNEVKTNQALVWTEKGRMFLHQLFIQKESGLL